MTDSDDTVEETPRRYRNPPIEHRFRKGVSGNPRGRPRKSRALVSTKIGGPPGIGFEDRVKSLAIEEAYRIIKIREGDRVENVPVIQAIIRKVAVAAATGNTRAQQTYLNLLIGAEADRRVATMEMLKAAVEYKQDWADTSLRAPAVAQQGQRQSQFLTLTTSLSTSRQEMSDSMVRLTRNRRRRRNGCVPTCWSSYEG